MKVIINEKQLARIIGYGKEIDEADAPTSKPSPAPVSTASTGGGTTSSTDDPGTSPGAADMPPYPEVGHWQSGLTRGPSNQIATKSKWSDVVGSKITRGHANPLK